MAVFKEKKQIKSKERVAERGEVFTAEREVNAMCDLVANECLRPDSRFLEPACGDGNFLAVILKRKLAELRRKYKKSPRDYEKQAIVAIGSLYGVDIMNDNVMVCRIIVVHLHAVVRQIKGHIGCVQEIICEELLHH
ncbi:MAG: hypothetical protein IKC70_04575, partial [Bacteroidaceae bacterium]|nr:hypothetical protein [Bacteroidaceae bacterium]